MASVVKDEDSDDADSEEESINAANDVETPNDEEVPTVASRDWKEFHAPSVYVMDGMNSSRSACFRGSMSMPSRRTGSWISLYGTAGFPVTCNWSGRVLRRGGMKLRVFMTTFFDTV